MLTQVLAQLAKGNITSLTDLASRLDVSLDLIEQMLLDLERAGYIASVNTDCQHNCAHCSQSSSCGLMTQGRIWSVTPKGLGLAHG
jgi:biotin synthase-like enzyme